MRVVVVMFGIAHEIPAGLLAEPLHEAGTLGQSHELGHAIERIVHPAAASFAGLRPLVNQREGKPHLGGDFLRAGMLEGFAKNFV